MSEPNEFVAVNVIVFEPTVLKVTVGLVAVEVAGVAPAPKFHK